MLQCLFVFLEKTQKQKKAAAAAAAAAATFMSIPQPLLFRFGTLQPLPSQLLHQLLGASLTLVETMSWNRWGNHGSGGHQRDEHGQAPGVAPWLPGAYYREKQQRQEAVEELGKIKANAEREKEEKSKKRGRRSFMKK